MRCAAVLAFASALLGVYGQPLAEMAGYPGEVKLLLFRAQTVEVPPDFLLLLPPEAFDGLVSVAVQVPALPAGNYPFVVDGEVYPFEVLPRAQVYLLSPPPLELALGEVGWATFTVQNLGNISFEPTPRVVATEVIVQRLEVPPVLAPGATGSIRVLLEGTGRGGKLALYLLQAQAEVLVGVRPTSPPPLWDWVRLPSRLTVHSSGELWLEGRGEVPLEGVSARLSYRLSSAGGSVSYGVGPTDFTFGLSRAGVNLGFRHAPPPFEVSLAASTAGEFRIAGGYTRGGISLALEGNMLPQPSFGVRAGLTGTHDGWSYGAQLGLDRAGGRFEVSLGRGAWRASGSLNSAGGVSARSVLSVGGGWSAGAGISRDPDDLRLQALLGIPLIGTIELQAEYALRSQRYRLSAFHILNAPQESLIGQLSWDQETWRYSMDYRRQWVRVGAQGGVTVQLGRDRGAQLRWGLAIDPLELRGSAQLDEGFRLSGLSLSGSLRFELPLYPMPWPQLTIRLQDRYGRPMTQPMSLVIGSYVFQTGRDGALRIRLPPASHPIRAPQGWAFWLDGELTQELVLQLVADQELHLTLLPAYGLTLELRFCPVDEVPGKVYGLPGLSPEMVLAGAQVLAQVGGSTWPLYPGRTTLLPAGELELVLADELSLGYAIRDIQGEEMVIALTRNTTLVACIVPLGRQVELQELEPTEP